MLRSLFVLLVVGLVELVGPGQVLAQAQIGFLNFGFGRRQQQPLAQPAAQPATDPALLALLQQLHADQQQLLALLAQRPPVANAPGSSSSSLATDPELLQVLRQIASQQQQLLARQTLPVVAPVLQPLPVAGAVLQPLPVAGQVQQPLPVAGQVQQTLPAAGPVQQTLPVGPSTPALPVTRGEAKYLALSPRPYLIRR